MGESRHPVRPQLAHQASTMGHCGRVGTGSPGATQQISHLPQAAVPFGVPTLTLSTHPHPSQCPCHHTPHAQPHSGPFFHLFLPGHSQGQGMVGAPLIPHNYSLPLGPACISRGDCPCCPLRQPPAQVLTWGTKKAGRWHFLGCPRARRVDSGLAHPHLGNRRTLPQRLLPLYACPMGKGP